MFSVSCSLWLWQIRCLGWPMSCQCLRESHSHLEANTKGRSPETGSLATNWAILSVSFIGCGLSKPCKQQVNILYIFLWRKPYETETHPLFTVFRVDLIYSRCDGWCSTFSVPSVFFFKTPGMGFSPIQSAAEPLFSEEVIGDCWWKEVDVKMDVKFSQKR